MNLCYNCMSEIDESGKCQKCGYVHSENTPPHRLKPGTKLLNNRYVVGNALGEGGFGITYIGFDTRLEMRVAIKEFFPSGFVTRFVKDSATVEASNDKNDSFFKKGKEKFLYEARTIARFSEEPGIVDVRDYFEENDTAYIIMEYIEGKNLKVYMREFGVFNVQALLTLFKPVFDALEKIHNVGLIHRDISPDNLMFTKASALKLMDFGASANFDEDNTSRGAIILKPGYAPLEQYDRNGNQGPWTDIYALCATIYKCITGITPDEATVREKKDDLKKPSELGVIIPTEVENALMKGLALNVSDRFNSISELKEILYGAEIAYSDISSGNKELYIDDNFETTVIDENFIGNDEDTALLTDEPETTVLSDELETGVLNESNVETTLLEDEPETSVLQDDFEDTALLSEEPETTLLENNSEISLVEEELETDILDKKATEDTVKESLTEQDKKQSKLLVDGNEIKEKKPFNKKLLFGIIGGVLLVAVVIIVVIIATSTNKPADNTDNGNSSFSEISDNDESVDYEEDNLSSNGGYDSIDSNSAIESDNVDNDSSSYIDETDDYSSDNNNTDEEDSSIEFDNDYLTLKTEDDWTKYVSWDYVGETYNFVGFEVVLDEDDNRYYLEIDGCRTYANADVSEYENKRVKGTLKLVEIPYEEDSFELAYDIISIEEY